MARLVRPDFTRTEGIPLIAGALGRTALRHQVNPPRQARRLATGRPVAIIDHPAGELIGNRNR